MEILLHAVVEEDAQASDDNIPTGGAGLLPTAIEFLDHFDDALDVVVGCARKIEMTRWPRLFDIVGNPKILFEVCYALTEVLPMGTHGFTRLSSLVWVLAG